jgi:POT family proton-dependent oligopeptide transporter
LLIVGNGFFKPNISSKVGQLYANATDKKEGAYTIFYMGINAGAFLGILFCGYIGEKVGWSYGFGLAGIFMALGLVMFALGRPIFGEVGKSGIRGSGAVRATDGEQAVPENVVRDRLVVIGILSFFTIR